MTFTNPGFLWALFAVAIPLIIHLLNFRAFRTVYFSNLRFIKQVEQHKRRRRKLKEYLILALRMLAIAALVLAFARPVKRSSTAQMPCKNEVAIYVDNSFSMTARGVAGSDIELAKKKAYEIVKAFPLDARFFVLTNDFFPEQFRSYTSLNVRDVIAGIKVSDRPVKITSVVNKLKNLLSTDTACMHYVFLLSDFQKTSADLDSIVFPANWKIFFIPITPSQVTNISVDSVMFLSPYHMIGHKDSLVALVRNYSSAAVKNLRVELWVNDSLRGFENINIPSGSIGTASFSFVPSSSGWNKARISVKDYDITFDDDLYFSFLVKDRFRILLISPDHSRAIQALYSYPLFDFSMVKPQNIPYSRINENDVVILDGLKDYSSGLIATIVSFVRQGGTAVIVPSLETYDGVNNLLIRLGLSPFTGRDTAFTRLWEINLNDDFYKGAVFSYEKNDLLPGIKSHLVRRPDYARERELLTARNGNPLLTFASVGKGRIFIFTFPMDERITDFVDNPLFVVTFVNIGIRSSRASRLFYIIGRDNIIRLGANGSEYYRLRQGEFTVIPPMRYAGGNVVLDLSGIPLKSGIYALENEEDSSVRYLAFNYDRNESVMDFFSARQLKQIIQRRHWDNVSIQANVLNDLTVAISKETQPQGLWKLFVILAIIFLILEVLVNRLIK